MLALSEKTQGLIEAELRIGRKLKEIEAIIDRVIRKASRRYRFKIADEAANDIEVPKEAVRKRSRIIPTRFKGKTKVGGLSYFAVFLPVAVLGAYQDNKGVNALRGISLPHHFITDAQKFGGGGRRRFVFIRQGKKRNPLREARIQLFQTLAIAVDKFEPDVFKFINEEITRELQRLAEKK